MSKLWNAMEVWKRVYDKVIRRNKDIIVESVYDALRYTAVWWLLIFWINQWVFDDIQSDIDNVFWTHASTPKSYGQAKTWYWYQITPEERDKIIAESEWKKLVLITRWYEKGFIEHANAIEETLDGDEFIIYTITTPHKRALSEALEWYGSAHPISQRVHLHHGLEIQRSWGNQNGLMIWKNNEWVNGRVTEEEIPNLLGGYGKYFDSDANFLLLSCEWWDVADEIANALGIPWYASKYDVVWIWARTISWTQVFDSWDEPYVSAPSWVEPNEEFFGVEKRWWKKHIVYRNWKIVGRPNTFKGEKVDEPAFLEYEPVE